MAADKVEWIADRLSECGVYEDVDVPVKADIFGFDIADVSGSIRLFSDVMKRLEMRFMRSFRNFMMRALAGM